LKIDYVIVYLLALHTTAQAKRSIFFYRLPFRRVRLGIYCLAICHSPNAVIVISTGGKLNRNTFSRYAVRYVNIQMERHTSPQGVLSSVQHEQTPQKEVSQ